MKIQIDKELSMFKNLLLLAIVCLIAVPSSHADRRKYVWTYQTTTIAPEATELEFYQTTKINENENDNWEYRIEVEQGISSKFDIGIYQIFSQEASESLKWNAFQLRGRYRFGLPGEVAFNPVLYLEYRRKIETTAGQNKIETKILLGKDVGKTNFSINPVFEYLWASGFDSYKEVGVDVGLSYAPSYKFAFGVESTTRQVYYTEIGKENKSESSFGPTISYATGENYYTVGIAFGLNDHADDTMVRFLMGIGL